MNYISVLPFIRKTKEVVQMVTDRYSAQGGTHGTGFVSILTKVTCYSVVVYQGI